jgi:hypothetical protein
VQTLPSVLTDTSCCTVERDDEADGNDSEYTGCV